MFGALGLGFVGVDDARDQRVAHHVLAGEAGEGDAAHVLEHFLRFDQAALLAAREIDLGDVAGDHRLGAEADAGQEHLHLLGRGVLRLVENDEGMVQRAPAHVGERRDLDAAALEQLADLLEPHQVVERVVERTQVGVDLLRQVPGQEAEALAGFDRRAHQHDALDRVALEGIHRAGHGEIGLAGAGRADAEGDVVLADLAQVLRLVRGARMQIAPAGDEHRQLSGLAGGRFGELDQAELDVFDVELRAGLLVEAAQRLRGKLGLLAASPAMLKLSPRRAMVTSSAVSICLRFSSSTPHRFASRWLSTGVKESSTGFKRLVSARRRRAASAPARR